ncbi:MAG: cyclase family protein [Microcoleaceae cyanobacterium]
MSSIIDISVGLQSQMPIWPGSRGFRLEQTMSLEAGEEANVSQLDTDVHVGTHVDAPWHFVTGGKTIEQLSLDVLMGEAVVAELPDVSAVTAKDLEALDLPQGTQRLLLHTRNSKLWENHVVEFQKDFVALTADAAQWVADRGIRLIGVDYLSVQRYGDSTLTHEILLGAETIVIEGLNLSGVQAGKYHLTCLPLKLVGAEGAPARAVLMPI